MLCVHNILTILQKKTRVSLSTLSLSNRCAVPGAVRRPQTVSAPEFLSCVFISSAGLRLTNDIKLCVSQQGNVERELAVNPRQRNLTGGFNQVSVASEQTIQTISLPVVQLNRRVVECVFFSQTSWDSVGQYLRVLWDRLLEYEKLTQLRKAVRCGGRAPVSVWFNSSSSTPPTPFFVPVSVCLWVWPSRSVSLETLLWQQIHLSV